MDATQFTSQLVQFSTVEQAVQTNSQLGQLTKLMQASSLTSALSLVGMKVEYGGGQVVLGQQGGASVAYTLPQGANKVTITIRDASGAVVRTTQGPTAAGNQSFAWDGLGDNGRRLPPGTYSVDVAAVAADGSPVEVSRGGSGTVDGSRPPPTGSGSRSAAPPYRWPTSPTSPSPHPDAQRQERSKRPMSLFGPLYTGVAGLAAQGKAMSMISDDIANVNITGYKGTTADFSTLVTENNDAKLYNSGSVQALAGQTITIQGVIQGTSSPTDAAIDGAGFFVVNSKPDGTGAATLHPRRLVHARQPRQPADRVGLLPPGLGARRQPADRERQCADDGQRHRRHRRADRHDHGQGRDQPGRGSDGLFPILFTLRS